MKDLVDEFEQQKRKWDRGFSPIPDDEEDFFDDDYPELFSRNRRMIKKLKHGTVSYKKYNENNKSFS